MPSAPEPLLDALPVGTLLVQESRVRAANLRAGELLGTSPARLVGAELAAALPQATDAVQRVLDGAASCAVPELRVDRLGVASERISLLASPGPEPASVVLVLQPVAATREAAFRRRIAWLDRLAAGVAHEIRNPLGGIRGAAQLLRRGVGPEHSDELVEMIIRDADRIDYQVERLMALCRPRELSPVRVNLNRLLHAEVRRLGPSELSWKLDLDPSLPELEADLGRLEEVFGNLLRNAAEAARGEVRVISRVDPGDLHRGSRGATLRVDVIDDGEGIPPERLDALFAPFDTTKADGTGLGLFLARLAVEDHGGLVQVEPGTGRGARFRVLLTEHLPPQAPAEAPSWAERGIG